MNLSDIAEPNPRIQKQLRNDIEYWEALKRRQYYQGGGVPPLVFNFAPPFLFDCRFTTSRRMGLGDQICLLATIQGVGDRVGWENVSICYDKAYPGSAAVFDMAGLTIIPPEDMPDARRRFTVIPCRQHLFESPIGGHNCGYYAEDEDCPLSQVYWNLGWHNLFKGYPVRLKLFPGRGGVESARKIAAGLSPFVTANPLEISRHNNNCTVAVWRDVLLALDKSTTILFGSGGGDLPAMRSFVAALNLPHKYRIISESLSVWKSLIDLADAHYTGNNSGMWLAFGSTTKAFLLQHEDPTHAHNTLWNYKPKWQCKNIHLIKI